MANLAELPSLSQPATSLRPPAPDYDQDIDAYLRSMESAPGRRPAPDYMALRTKRGDPVTPAIRAALVGWLSSLGPTLHFDSRTLHLAVLCLDRFLAAARARPAVPSVRKLVTITAAALLVASKYEEIYPAEVEELVNETSRTRGGGCTTDELLAAEAAVLTALRYDLGAPTACTFLEHFMERLGVYAGDSAAAQLASRLVELSLLDYGVLRFRPSVVAASAILAARMTTRPSDDNPWGDEHEGVTGYTAAGLKECAERLNRLHRNSAQYVSSTGFEDVIGLRREGQREKKEKVNLFGGAKKLYL